MSPKPNLRVAGPAPEPVAGGPVEFDELFARYGRYVAHLTARLLGSAGLAGDGDHPPGGEAVATSPVP